MASVSSIPNIVIGRLPAYLRTITQFAQQGQQITSSYEMSQWLGVSSAQIRKDLSYFGGLGKQGTGYHIPHLQTQLKQILQINHVWPMIVVGAGDLGRAIAHYGGFIEQGFRVVAVFDNDPAKIGMSIDEFRVQNTTEMADLIQKRNVKIAMVAVPPSHAQQVTDKLVEVGVRAILNYAPITLIVPKHVHVQYVDPVMHLQRMSYYLEHEDDMGCTEARLQHDKAL